VKLQLVKKSTPLPVQAILFIPCILTTASHLRKRGLSRCQAHHRASTCGTGLTHPSSSTSPCFSFWPSALCLGVHVPHKLACHVPRSLLHLICSPCSCTRCLRLRNAPEAARQAGSLLLGAGIINEFKGYGTVSAEPRSCSTAAGSGLKPALSCPLKLMSKSRVRSLWLARKTGAQLGDRRVCQKTGISPVELGSELSLRKHVSGQFFLSVSE